MMWEEKFSVPGPFRPMMMRVEVTAASSDGMSAPLIIITNSAELLIASF
jgi:hypothetical protein